MSLFLIHLFFMFLSNIAFNTLSNPNKIYIFRISSPITLFFLFKHNRIFFKFSYFFNFFLIFCFFFKNYNINTQSICKWFTNINALQIYISDQTQTQIPQKLKTKTQALLGVICMIQVLKNDSTLTFLTLEETCCGWLFKFVGG